MSRAQNDRHKRSKEIYIESFLKKAIKQKGLFLLNLMMKSNQEMKINSLLKAELISLAIRLKVLNNDILEKLNIEKFNYDDSTLISMHKSTLVFNMLTNRLECYDSDAIANYGDYLAPVSKKLGVLSLSHRNQHLNIFTDKLGGLIAHDDADAPPANYLPLILNTKDGYLFISSSDGLVVSAWPNGNIDIRKTEIKAWEMFYTN